MTPTGAGEQEILLHKVIRRLEPRLMQAMADEMQMDPGESGARATLMQAIVLLALKGWHRKTFTEAAGMIEMAIAREPDFALSHAYLALLLALGHRVGLLRDDDATVPAVIAAVERSLDLENQDSTILGLAGCALADVGHVDRALPILQKAIESNPENGHAQNEALEAAESACKEDDRLYLPRLSLAAVHLVRKDQIKAVAAVQECLRAKPDLDRQEVIAVVGDRLGAGVWAIAEALTDRGTPDSGTPLTPPD